MGNRCGKLTLCFTAGGGCRRRKDMTAVMSDALDDLGHAFCYVRPAPTILSSSKALTEDNSNSTTTTFKSISGAAVSANTSTPLSTAFINCPSASASASFESSNSFASIPLQPIPRGSGINSGALSTSGLLPGSGSIERGFLSGPIERGFMSGPLEKGCSDQFRRSFSHGGFPSRQNSNTLLSRVLQRALSKSIINGQSSTVAPMKENDLIPGFEKDKELMCNSVNLSSDSSFDDYESMESQSLEWAQGKAGEDRVHVVVSEEHGWVFVGIYDGFNGPDAPDYLLSNLYSAVHKELKGLLWDDKFDSSAMHSPATVGNIILRMDDLNQSVSEEGLRDRCKHRGVELQEMSYELGPSKKKEKISRGKFRRFARKWEEHQRKWMCEFDREKLKLDGRLKERLDRDRSNGSGMVNHSDVLKALAQALKKTEQAYLDLADKLVTENPELALMGSCVLVMLMKGDNVYVMNVGDSQAVLAQKKVPAFWSQDLERIKEESFHDLKGIDGDKSRSSLDAFQLTMEHSTSREEEVQRIRREHPDDFFAVTNDRVKGSLKVTRAFGAGFLKQPKWNDALLEMFRIDYVGSSPYINCLPSLYHHQLGPRDRFLILLSDGLYQYFTNEEAVSEIEHFICFSPEGDPAQHLVEELLFRAAKKAGMDFHELLEIPPGEKRRFHDDVSIIVISLEGRIWRSCV